MSREMQLDVIFNEIMTERDYQVERWGNEFDDKNTPNDWASYIMRYAAATCEFDLGQPKGGPMTDKQREQYATMMKERRREQLIKVATLAVAAIEAQDRVGIVPRHYDGGFPCLVRRNS